MLDVLDLDIWRSPNERQYWKVRKFVRPVNFVDIPMLRHRYYQELCIFILKDV